MKSVRPFIVGFIVTFLCGALASADTPTTMPATTQPTVALAGDSPVRGWFADLASDDAGVRDQAFTSLMGISRAELDGLKLLIQNGPVPTAPQAAAMHDIVIQAFLSGETYATVAGTDDGPLPGFMGLRWKPLAEYAMGFAVPVDERIPGFPGFQMLRDGDLIVGIYINPEAPLDQLPNQRTPNQLLIISTVQRAVGLKQVVLEVLRQGQRIRVPVRLAPRPSALLGNEEQSQPFLTDRQQRAEAYWQQEFLPLLQQASL